jgi:apolipoprotein N-acyltransferase
MKSEIRNPKSEGNPKPEIPNGPSDVPAEQIPADSATSADGIQGLPGPVGVAESAGRPGGSWLANGTGIVAILVWVLVAAAAFHAAYASATTNWLILVYLAALLRLARTETWRKAFYPGLAVGLLIAAVRLAFFWRIFSVAACVLWLVYAFWIGLFVALARLCLRRLGPAWGWVAIPFVWTGLEYFRSELYYLRFSWLNVGYAFANEPWLMPIHPLGVYGLGFALMAILCGSELAWRKSAVFGSIGGVLCFGLFFGWGLHSEIPKGRPATAVVTIAGIQMEFPTEATVLLRLNDLLRQHPETELVVLCEYTFTEPVPEKIKGWCRTNRRHLIVGGQEPTQGTNFFNTAFVIGPTGEIVFRQVKCVPIQFFKDGLPAREQRLWDSPWGKIGLCICYDLSYTRVTDELIRQGAQAIICPTMDVETWGRDQHELHARIAPVRAAEYGVPIFRLASSGISQNIASSGHVLATAPFPGDAAVLAGQFALSAPGRLPLDRWLAPLCVAVTALILAACVGLHFARAKAIPAPSLTKPVRQEAAPCPRLFLLDCPEGWNTEKDYLSGRLLSSDDPPFGLSWKDLNEEMIFVTSSRCSLAIDLGWYPDYSPEVQFLVQVIDMENCLATYTKPLREFATRSVWAAKQKMEEWMKELHASPAEPNAAPKELDPQVVGAEAVSVRGTPEAGAPATAGSAATPIGKPRPAAEPPSMN